MYIRNLRVTNYRSLRDVAIGDLDQLVILYGENDTGKSNILTFLELVFREKYIEEVTDVSGGTSLSQKRVGGFWRGVIEGFSDNFYRNGNEPITFKILIRFTRKEISSLQLPKTFLTGLSRNAVYDHLELEGRIESTIPDQAVMTLDKAAFNQKSFYDLAATESARYLPGFNKLSADQKRRIFEAILSTLNNSFLRISPARFLVSEKEFPRQDSVSLRPDTLKNWLFRTSIDRGNEKTFRQVLEQFGNAPFNHGRVSVARIDEEDIEAFVEDQNGLKLPIGRKGSGIQQILIILSHIAETNASFLGIEELEINLSPGRQASIFNKLHQLVNTEGGLVRQVFLTTHSPHIAKRNEAQRRGVWMEQGETHVKKPSEAEVEDFFKFL